MDDLVWWLADQMNVDERSAKAAMDFPTGGDHLIPRDPTGRWLLPGGKWRHRPGDHGTTVVEDQAGRVIVPADHDQEQNVHAHVAEHDPMRVLDELTAKEKLIAWALKQPPATTEKVVRLLAVPYAHRPGYREEWRP